MRIAVTGVTGHIGGVIARKLMQQGHEVWGLVRRGNPLSAAPGIKLISGDLSNLTALKQLTDGVDAVIHCAGLIRLGYHFDRAVHDVNVTGTKNILAAAKESGVKKVVVFSSIDAYNPFPKSLPMNESRGFVGDKATFYGRTKRDAQILAMETTTDNFPVVVVVPTAVLGPFDYKPSSLGAAILNIGKGRIPFSIQGGFNFVDVRDVAEGAILSLERGKGGEAYFLGGAYCAIKTFSEKVLMACGRNQRLIPLPLFLAYLGLPFIGAYSKLRRHPPLYEKSYLNILKNGAEQILSDKAERELGYRPRTLEETIEDTVNWFKKQGKL